MKINPDIAEIIGAFIGDGWIEYREKGLYITGCPTEDKLYYDNYLAPLFSKHLQKVKPKNFTSWKVYGIASYRKEVINKALKMGCQKGEKCLTVEIPNVILKEKDHNIIKSLLRGIFDTDGSFWCERSRAKTSTLWKRTHNYHPEFRITSCSKKLLEQIKYLLDELKIESKVVQKSEKKYQLNRNRSPLYALNIRKIKEIEKWFKIIGTSNPRHQTRYQVWKKLGYLPPRTTIHQRFEILNS